MRIKPVVMFWLVFAALAFQSAVAFLGFGFTIVYAVGITLFAAIIFIPALTVPHGTAGRNPFILAGGALVYNAFRAWGAWQSDFGMVFELFALIALVAIAIYLGLLAYKQPLHRALATLSVLGLGAFYLYGARIGGENVRMLFYCLLIIAALFTVGWIFLAIAQGFSEAGAEDYRRMQEGKPPKYGPPPFGKNNPFKK